jgi:RNA polymerase sigma factor (sigma-70 family)
MGLTATETEDLLRRLAPQILGSLVRRYGNFDRAEDATQEALLAAAMQWPRDGAPKDPMGWLITVASRRLTDLLRADHARRRREERVAQSVPTEVRDPCDPDRVPADGDDTLILLFMCCHPSLPLASQIALTLRAVGGLTTAEIARAFLTSEETLTRRITRSKQSIKDSGIPFAMPAGRELLSRLDAVQRVLYLIFNEGYASTLGASLQRVDLAEEAIRLARTLAAALPQDSESSGLLALMVLTHARHRARSGPDGALIPMSEQDRTLWDRDAIREGVDLITTALPNGPTGPYQLQAAIAALHDEAASIETTDWQQIVALYGVLLRLDGNPVVALNHAVAVSMVQGPAAGLDLLRRLESDPRMNANRQFHAVRAHLHEMTGDISAARDDYETAAREATNLQRQRYLHQQIARLTAGVE